MAAFFLYLQNITYFLIFVTVVGMVAPTGKYRKFVSMVMGFALLSFMLSPLARVANLSSSGLFAGFSALATPSNMYWQNAHTHTTFDTQLAAQFEAQLEIGLANMLAHNGFVLHAAQVSFSQDFTSITAVNASVSAAGSARRVPFIRIQPIEVTRNAHSTAENCETTTTVQNLISQFYNIDSAHIHVTVT